MVSRIAAVVIVVGVAACAAASPPASTAGPPSPVASVAAPMPSDLASPHPSASARPGLGSELQVHVLPNDVTGPIGEFVSDAAGVVYAGDADPGSGPGSTADLWRFVPGPGARPALLWRNPARDRAIVKLAGELGTIGFVEVPLSGERAWNLWLLPEPGVDPILLDTHPGDEAVSSLVPSIAVHGTIVVWTAFDRGPSGPVSQLLTAAGPDWTPRVVLERAASEAELWLPSLYGTRAVFTEVRYAPDRRSDERSVHLVDVGDPASVPRRLDASGRATMPLTTADSVVWKETDPGFSMFNWGRMAHHDLRTGETTPMSTWPQEYVNYPSIGSRFVAWWGADSFSFGVYDLVRSRARIIDRFAAAERTGVARPHVAGDFLVWLHVVGDAPNEVSELRWAFLPNAGADR